MERMIRLKAPANIAAVQYGGEEFKVRNGYVVVPMTAEPFLTASGFRLNADPPILIYRPAELKVAHGRR